MRGTEKKARFNHTISKEWNFLQALKEGMIADGVLPTLNVMLLYVMTKKKKENAFFVWSVATLQEKP